MKQSNAFECFRLPKKHPTIVTLDQIGYEWDHEPGDLVLANNQRGGGVELTPHSGVVVDMSGHKPTIIKINRGCFNPEEFIGPGWSIVGKETDSLSAQLTEIDLTKVSFETCFGVPLSSLDNNIVYDERKLSYLKTSGKIRLSADIFLTLLHNYHVIPDSWTLVQGMCANGRADIFFDGTVLRTPHGNERCVLHLCWTKHSGWFWDVERIGIAPLKTKPDI